MANYGHICQRLGSKFGSAQLDHLGNIIDKFQRNLKNSLEGSATTGLLQCSVKRVTISRMAIWWLY